MATTEEPVAAVESVPQVDAVKQEDVQAAPASPPAAAVIAAAPSSVASPTPSTLSPRQTIPTTPQQVYPKPLATHDAVLADEQLFMETFYRFHTVLKSRPT